MKNIVSFDLDGTLITNKFADLVWLEGLPELYAKEYSIDFENAKKNLKIEYDKIGDNRVEWYDLGYWFKRLKLKSDWNDLLYTYKDAIRVYSDVSDVLQKLYENFDLIITSNAKREFIDMELKETNIKKYFSYIFSSTSDFHEVKKIAEFYLMICDTLDINPNELIHIGDHKKFDYLIPTKVGVTSFYLDRTRSTFGDFIVSDLYEFEVKINNLVK
jgi:putative hydrolase of the HAD superfamily